MPPHMAAPFPQHFYPNFPLLPTPGLLTLNSVYMKRNSFFSGRVFAGAIACMMCLLIWSCEPEGMEIPTENAALKMSKSEKGNLPHREIAQVRASVAQYRNFKKATAAGWGTDITGYIPHMGHHWANFALFDNTFDMLNPEILIFIPDQKGHQRFVGVEYIIPIADMGNPPPAPEGFPGDADFWVINEDAEAWTLHLWIGLNNPDGIFEMHNRRIP